MTSEDIIRQILIPCRYRRITMIPQEVMQRFAGSDPDGPQVNDRRVFKGRGWSFARCASTCRATTSA